MAKKPKGVISLKRLKQLIDRDLMRFAGDEEMLKATQRRGEVEVWLYTATNTYHVMARSSGATSLKCVVTSRLLRAGAEGHTDQELLLKDTLTRRGWQRLKDAMLACELVPLGYPDHHARKAAEVQRQAVRVLSGHGKVTARPVDRAALAEFRRRA